MQSYSAIGRLTKDPERFEAGETTIVNMRVAVDRQHKEGAVFFDVKCFGKQAAACDQYLHKGSAIGLKGRWELDEWEDKETNEPRSKLYVVAERVRFLDGSPADPDDAAEAV